VTSTGNRLVKANFDARGAQSGDNFVEVLYGEGRVGLFGGKKILFDAEV
jgi:hypothetical protein